MENMANGLFRINQKDIPVFYDDTNEKLTVYFNAEGVTIPDDTKSIITRNLGLLTDGLVLYKLCVPLFNTCTINDGNTLKAIAQGTQTGSVDYYITNYKVNTKYTEIKMQFTELDSFLPSKGRARVDEKQIVFSRERNHIYHFDIDFRGIKVDVYFDEKINANSKYNVTAKTVSELTLKFPETEEIDFIIDLYNRTRNFFCFICNRQNIALRDAVLVGNYMGKDIDENKTIIDKEYRTEQKIFFNQRYLEPLEDLKASENVPNIRYFANKLKELFQLFFEINNEESLVNSSSIHHSFKYRNLIDLEHSLHITATFEYYIRSILPEMSSQTTIDFIEDMRVLLDTYISSASGAKKKKAKDFKKSLNPQISLESKIIKAYNGYTGWLPLSDILSEWFGQDVAELAKIANEWRNELAHEKRTYQPNINVIRAMRLVEHMNYSIVLRTAGYSDKEIKNILTEILAR